MISSINNCGRIVKFKTGYYTEKWEGLKIERSGGHGCQRPAGRQRSIDDDDEDKSE